MKVTIPLRLSRGLNDRPGHWSKRHGQVKTERAAVGYVLNPNPRPALPCTVTITRVHSMKGKMLDKDNLQGACKATRDEVARWLGVDDADPRVTWVYEQLRAEVWAVAIEVTGAGDAV